MSGKIPPLHLNPNNINWYYDSDVSEDSLSISNDSEDDELTAPASPKIKEKLKEERFIYDKNIDKKETSDEL